MLLPCLTVYEAVGDLNLLKSSFIVPMERYETGLVRNRHACSRSPAKRNETHTSVTPAGRCGGPFVRNRRVCSLAANNKTKRTCQLNQRGVVVGPLFETGVCAHIWSLIVVDDAIIDGHNAATINGNASTL